MRDDLLLKKIEKKENKIFLYFQFSRKVIFKSKKIYSIFFDYFHTQNYLICIIHLHSNRHLNFIIWKLNLFVNLRNLILFFLSKLLHEDALHPLPLVSRITGYPVYSHFHHSISKPSSLAPLNFYHFHTYVQCNFFTGRSSAPFRFRKLHKEIVVPEGVRRRLEIRSYSKIDGGKL